MRQCAKRQNWDTYSLALLGAYTTQREGIYTLTLTPPFLVPKTLQT